MVARPAVLGFVDDTPPARRSSLYLPLTGANVTVVIPAHNEQDGIGAAIRSVLRQTTQPGRVIVASDNSIDATVAVAQAYDGHVEVFETVDNAFRKAGALNQAMRRFRRRTDDRTRVIVTMDADTELARDFVAQALAELNADQSLGGVCARFVAKPGRGLLTRLQRLEFLRYDESRALWRHGQVSVLSGTGCAYRREVLTQVASRRLTGPWSIASIVEDYTLTLDIREAGFHAKAGDGMVVYTETQPTVGQLWTQRLRWTAGTLHELRARGWGRYTYRDIVTHIMATFMIALKVLWIALIGSVVLSGGAIEWHPIWALPIVLTIVDRVWMLARVPDRSWRDVVTVVLLAPEEIYQFFREAVLMRSLIASGRSRGLAWR